MASKTKLLVIGLDSVPSSLLFEELKDELPNIKKMIDNGISCVLESCHPPITIPAWMVMMTSKSPGRLGIYGFRHRQGFSYTEGWIANSRSIREKKVWDYLAQEGKRVCLVGVPPTYPPIQVNGKLVSCFVTPSDKNDYTYPSEFKQDVEQLVGKYLFDVIFRTKDRDAVLKQLYEMTEKRFKLIKHMISKEVWDFTMFVEIGVDRLHHAFWKFHDRKHPKYIAGNKYENAIREYYRFIDQKIGELLEIIDDDTYVLTVSDHGTAGMQGAFCINEWLIKEGYLVLKNYPSSVTDLDKCEIDWGKTKAWGWGGYYARIFFNVKGREKNGVIPPDEYNRVREELRSKLMQIKDPTGRIFDTKVYTPEELYGQCNGDKPDLMVYFDNLYWRSAGTIGHNSLYLSENDTGPDDSVHWYDGIFILYNKKKKNGIKLKRMTIYDVAPNILSIMNMQVPTDMEGRVVPEISKWANGIKQ
ncbi:MAG: alkaline phosphatase family protein [Nitrososphaerales archaeon]